MKVIYIFEQRFPYVSDEVTFGYEVFWKHGWDVEVWVLTEWLLHISEKDISEDIRLDKSHYIFFCRNKADFINCLQRVQGEDAFCICYPYHAYNENSCSIRKLIMEYGIPFANLVESPGFDHYLNRPLPVTFIRAIKKTFRIFFLGNGYYFCQWLLTGCKEYNWLSKIVDSVYRLAGPFAYRAQYNFIRTELAWYFCPNMFEKWTGNNVLIHATTYSEYLQAANKKNIEKGKYVVFIDQGLINRDNVFEATGDDIPIRNKKIYLDDLNHLFCQVEKRYNCPVIIAAHPKACYKGDEFCGRKMVFGKTNVLIRDAELVINQFSTAFLLVALFKKDFLAIFTKELWETKSEMYKKYYQGFKSTGCKLLDISNHHEADRFNEYVCNFDEQKFTEIKNAGIIDDDSQYRDKVFFEYVYDSLNQWQSKK